MYGAKGVGNILDMGADVLEKSEKTTKKLRNKK